MDNSFRGVDIADNRRKATRSGFEEDFGGSLPGGREQKYICTPVFLPQFFGGQHFQKSHIAQSITDNAVFECGPKWSISGESEVYVGKTCRRIQQKLRLLEYSQ